MMMLIKYLKSVLSQQNRWNPKQTSPRIDIYGGSATDIVQRGGDVVPRFDIFTGWH